jgi:2-methylisocitrate lyase-like PEP mutase family enzyme
MPNPTSDDYPAPGQREKFVKNGSSFRGLLENGGRILAPGCWDSLTALMIEQAGFTCAYLSGASIAYSRLGRSDVGLTTFSEVLDVASNITDRVRIPLVVDIDNGYGNALNVQRTVRLLERAGVAAMQLEDQTSPKRCGHLNDKVVVPATEMVGKIKAAVDARVSSETVIIARSDAVAVEGYDAAIARGYQYIEAGCDVLFIEAPENRQQLQDIATRFSGQCALLANMVEGGKTPLSSADELFDLGYSIVIFPGALARAFAFMGAEFFKSLKQHGTTAPFQQRMLTFDGLNAVIETPALLALGKRYDNGQFRSPA